MAKQQLKRRQTTIQGNQGQLVGAYEQTLTIDERALPSPEELAQYKAVDAKIVDYLIEASQKEQEHRHLIEEQKVKTIKQSEKRTFNMNWWGMFFAFLALIVVIGLAAYALYLGAQWFAGGFGLAGVIGIISVFTNAGRRNKQ